MPYHEKESTLVYNWVCIQVEYLNRRVYLEIILAFFIEVDASKLTLLILIVD